MHFPNTRIPFGITTENLTDHSTKGRCKACPRVPRDRIEATLTLSSLPYTSYGPHRTCIDISAIINVEAN